MTRDLLNSFVGKITSSIIHIISNSLDMDIFLDNWKTSRVCRIPNTDNPMNAKKLPVDSDLTHTIKVLRKNYSPTTAKIRRKVFDLQFLSICFPKRLPLSTAKILR